MLCTWLLLSHSNRAMLAFWISANWSAIKHKEKRLISRYNVKAMKIIRRTSRETAFLIAVLEEVPITNSCAEKLFGQNAQECRTGQCALDVCLQSTAHRQINILKAGVQLLQIAHRSWCHQVQEVLPLCRPTQATEFTVVVVAGKAVITIPLDIDGLQITTEWCITFEEEVLHFWIQIIVVQLFGLCAEASGECVVVVGHLENGGAIEPIA